MNEVGRDSRDLQRPRQERQFTTKPVILGERVPVDFKKQPVTKQLTHLSNQITRGCTSFTKASSLGFHGTQEAAVYRVPPSSSRLPGLPTAAGVNA
jgi:hypothetical protein